MEYDIVVIGSGPGGYVAAIRAAQLGLKTAVIEKAEVGGICLNWGCIPTKALLKSAQVYNYMSHSGDYGIKIESSPVIDFQAVVSRSRGVASKMSKGVDFLFKKNGVELINGFGKILGDGNVEVKSADGSSTNVKAKNIILATGAKSRILPSLPQDGKKIIGYREAMTLQELPKSMVVVGSGAIGSEFAFFYQSMGVQVTLVEFMPNIVPLEDEEASKNLERAFKKIKMKVMTSSSVESVDTSSDLCKVFIKTPKGEEVVEAEVVLSAVGISTNLEGLGLDEIGVKHEFGKVIVDEFYKTNVTGIFAIGDIVHGPALAHVASSEGIICVEKIAGHHPKPLDYNNIPGCTYTTPEVASVGLTEKKALELGHELKVGKFPFQASGKATAAGNNDGFIKLIIDKNTDDILGCSMVGDNVTEMIEEVVIARRLGMKGHELLATIHPHPTMSEAVMEAAAAAYGEAIHIINQ